MIKNCPYCRGTGTPLIDTHTKVDLTMACPRCAVACELMMGLPPAGAPIPVMGIKRPIGKDKEIGTNR